MPANTLTVAEVASRYGVSEHTVLKWIDSAELRAVNVARARTAKRPSWRIPSAAIDAFETARASTPKVETGRRRKAAADVIEFY